jgi:hypothetical protein
MTTTEYHAYLYNADGDLLDQTSLDELAVELAWELFDEFSKEKSYIVDRDTMRVEIDVLGVA